MALARARALLAAFSAVQLEAYPQVQEQPRVLVACWAGCLLLVVESGLQEAVVST
jgi:hypothetical protein